MPVWAEGTVHADSEPVVSAFDRGFLYGDGLFETLRVEGGVPLFLDAHLDRLRGGLRTLGIPAPREALVRRAAQDLCAQSRGRQRLRIAVTRGAGPTGLLVPRRPLPFLVASLAPAGPTLKEVRAVWATAPATWVAPRLKSLHYLPSILAKREAEQRGADDAILLNRSGRAVEATTANLFGVREGVLLTPPLSDGALDGITRRHVFGIARSTGIEAREAPLYPGDLLSCQEVFLTASVSGIVPVTSLAGRRVGQGSPGRITRKLQRLMEKSAERERKRNR